MNTIEIMQMPHSRGEKVILKGWLHNVRHQKSVSFIVVRDGWSTDQAVVSDERVIQRLKELPRGAAVELLGTVQTTQQTQSGFEFHVEAIRFEGGAMPASELPDISKKELNLHADTALNHAPQVLRRPEVRFRHRLAAQSVSLFRAFLDAEGFTEIHTPKINGGSMEGGSNVFALDYFGSPAFLAQSPQLHKQIMVGVFQKVYETAAVFRAEPHATVRHLNEYMSLDVEMGFIRSHRDVMDVVNRLLAFMAKRLYELVLDWDERFAVPWTVVPDQIPVVSFERAQEIAAEKGAETAEDDLTPAAEKQLGAWALENHNSEFLFVEGYPMSVRPFYTMPDSDNPARSRSFDLLFRGQELITGGQRLHRAEDYRAVMQEKGMDIGSFDAYLEAFEAGMPPHGGFAIGLERWIQSLLNLPNIRMASLFPRDAKRLSP